MDSKSFLPAWNYEEKTIPTSCLLCSFAMGIVFLSTGSVLTAIFRKIPVAADIAMGGVALIVLGVVLVVTGLLLAFAILFARQKLPKTSSAAKADVPPDPFSLLPVYPANARPVSTDVATSTQILLLPGGIDPIYSPFGT